MTFINKNGFSVSSEDNSDNPVMLVLNFDDKEKNGWSVKKNVESDSDIPVFLIPTNEKSISYGEISEVLAVHINKLLSQRREKSSDDDNEFIKHGLLEVNLDSYQIFFDKHLVDLTYTEYAILKCLLRNASRVYSRENIMDFSYGINVYINYRTIDSHIRYIRKKFAAHGCYSVIKTVHGIGYKIGECKLAYE